MTIRHITVAQYLNEYPDKPYKGLAFFGNCRIIKFYPFDKSDTLLVSLYDGVNITKQQLPLNILIELR